MNLKCFFGFHKWVYGERKYYVSTPLDMKVTRQTRCCEHCQKEQERKTRNVPIRLSLGKSPIELPKDQRSVARKA